MLHNLQNGISGMCIQEQKSVLCMICMWYENKIEWLKSQNVQMSHISLIVNTINWLSSSSQTLIFFFNKMLEMFIYWEVISLFRHGPYLTL
jgi:hypothetical protein